jgi:hypothetical protein
VFKIRFLNIKVSKCLSDTIITCLSQLFLFFLVVSTTLTNYLGWYDNPLAEQVGLSYVAVYHILEGRIIAPLLDVDPDVLKASETDTTYVVKLITCGAIELKTHLGQTRKITQQLGSSIAEELTSIVSQVSAAEAEIEQVQKRVKSVTFEIDQVMMQIRRSEDDVAVKQAAVNAAEARVREGQEGGKKTILLPCILNFVLCT